MKFDVYTYGLPQSIVLSLTASGNVTVKGVDPQLKCVYFDEEIDAATIKALKGVIEINCPLVPDMYMEVTLTGSNVKLLSIGAKALPAKPLYLSPENEEYLDCLEWFAVNAKTLEPGAYTRGKITIDYQDSFPDNPNTPARVDHDSGVTEFSRAFIKKYSVPMIVFIGLHERSHYELATDNESVADKNGLNMYLSRAYPKIEGIYAATKVFSDNAESRQRTHDMIDFINNW